MYKTIALLLFTLLPLVSFGQEISKKDAFNLGYTCNVSRAQMGLRFSYYNNKADDSQSLGFYVEAKFEAKRDVSKGTNYSDMIINNQLNHEERGEFDGGLKIINAGIVKRLHKDYDVFGYLGMGFYNKTTYMQMYDPSQSLDIQGYYYYELDRETDVVLNVGVEAYWKVLIFNAGYDVNIDGLNLGLGFRLR